MSRFQLHIKLMSDTTFGRGDGVAGLLDQEVEHDPFGFPYLRGRTLKGLLSEECDNMIACLPDATRHHWEQRACELFGTPGSTLETIAALHIGDARLPDDVRQAVAFQIRNENLTRAEVLSSLTTIRRQTAIQPETGIPDRGGLRALRVVLRDLTFTADLLFEQTPTDDMQTLLSVGALALRHLGSGRNRGRGHVRCHITNEQADLLPQKLLDPFITAQAQEV
ncbi:MAG: RAMP superfamily CRISPR-associated protein [Cyanobacteria bacterium P01_F01_bin.150]